MLTSGTLNISLLRKCAQLDPRRFLQILHFPIKAMRIITDPVVDSVVFLIMHFIFPPMLRAVNMIANLTFRSAMYLTAKAFGQHTADKSSELSTEMVCDSLFPSVFTC
jgi:E3 ubiquitin-protein ligase MARCH6